jgi:hypothetical protein
LYGGRPADTEQSQKLLLEYLDIFLEGDAALNDARSSIAAVKHLLMFGSCRDAAVQVLTIYVTEVRPGALRQLCWRDPLAPVRQSGPLSTHQLHIAATTATGSAQSVTKTCIIDEWGAVRHSFGEAGAADCNNDAESRQKCTLAFRHQRIEWFSCGRGPRRCSGSATRCCTCSDTKGRQKIC